MEEYGYVLLQVYHGSKFIGKDSFYVSDVVTAMSKAAEKWGFDVHDDTYSIEILDTPWMEAAQEEVDRELHKFMSENPGYLDGAEIDDSDHQYRPSL